MARQPSLTDEFQINDRPCLEPQSGSHMKKKCLKLNPSLPPSAHAHTQKAGQDAEVKSREREKEKRKAEAAPE